MNQPTMKLLPLEQINPNEKAQPRVTIDQHLVDEYAQEIREGAVFPPITVFYDGRQYWLADGFHRHHAHQQTGAAAIMAEVREGTLKDAILYSVSANATHGLRRSHKDKRRAVRTLLEDWEWRKWSEREIAKRCGVSRSLVAGVKKELEKEGYLAEKPDTVVTFTRRGKSHVMKVENIGSKPKENPASTSELQPSPEESPAAPMAADAIRRLHRIYEDFSALPLAETVAGVIKEHQDGFCGKQASEMSTWFRALAHLLDGGSDHNQSLKRSPFPSLHSPSYHSVGKSPE